MSDLPPRKLFITGQGPESEHVGLWWLAFGCLFGIPNVVFVYFFDFQCPVNPSLTGVIASTVSDWTGWFWALWPKYWGEGLSAYAAKHPCLLHLSHFIHTVTFLQLVAVFVAAIVIENPFQNDALSHAKQKGVSAEGRREKLALAARWFVLLAGMPFVMAFRFPQTGTGGYAAAPIMYLPWSVFVLALWLSMTATFGLMALAWIGALRATKNLPGADTPFQ